MRKILGSLCLTLATIMGATMIVNAEGSNVDVDLTYGKTIELDLGSTSNELVNTLKDKIITSKDISYWKLNDDNTFDNDANSSESPQIKVTYDNSSNKAILSLNINEPVDGEVNKTVVVNTKNVIFRYGFTAQIISRVDITGVKLNYFTGERFVSTTLESDKYYIYVEGWDEVGGDETHIKNINHWTTWDESKSRVIFEANKKYTYMIWIKNKDSSGYIFDENTKIYINGANYTDKIASIDYQNIDVEGVTSIETTNGVGFKDDILVKDSSDNYVNAWANKAKIEVSDNYKIFSVSGIDVDYDMVTQENLLTGYDNGAALYINKVLINSSDNYFGVKFSMPIPKGFSNSSAVITIGDNKYNAIAYSKGYAVFEIPLKYYAALNEYNLSAFIFFKKGSNEDEASLVYAILDGKGQVSTENSNDLVFRIDADFNLFKDLYIDGILVDQQYYTIAEGSTIITLSRNYLVKLKNGTHTLKATYTTGGEAIVDFEVRVNNPDTRDSISINYVLLTISFLSILGASVYLCKKFN